MKRFFIFVIVVTLCVFALSKCYVRREPVRIPQKFTPAEGARIDSKDLRGLLEMDAQYQKLVDSVVPSVVSITTSRRVRTQNPVLIDPFEHFLGAGSAPRRRNAFKIRSAPASSFQKKDTSSPTTTSSPIWMR